MAAAVAATAAVVAATAAVAATVVAAVVVAATAAVVVTEEAAVEAVAVSDTDLGNSLQQASPCSELEEAPWEPCLHVTPKETCACMQDFAGPCVPDPFEL